MTIREDANSKNWLLRAPGDIERIEARLFGAAFAPHRHDVYAIGMTLAGVQCFDYRGSTRYSMPGQFVILHPDELHDGRAGDGDAFQYRTAYVSPALIHEVLGGRSLPFVEGGVSTDQRLRRPISALLGNCDQPLTALEQQEAIYDLAHALKAVSGGAKQIGRVNRKAVLHARNYIDANIQCSFSLSDLERVAHHGRWQLCRDFRQMFGTSPFRYLVLRRLDRARRMMLEGRTGAEVATDCGFSDQSHFCRHFKRSFGMTPSAWLSAASRAHDHSIPSKVVLPN